MLFRSKGCSKLGHAAERGIVAQDVAVHFARQLGCGAMGGAGDGFIHRFQNVQKERCGTVAYETQFAKGNPKRETKQQFEDWMQRIQTAPASKLKTQAKNQTQSTFVIPVVVHVVHNGEPVGTGVNISDAQILSQITVLNNDFNRLNADRVNTPSTFQSVAGSFDVQFVLAKQDPSGIATNGIRRVQGSKTSWKIGRAHV